jgi:hypothetical protein
MKLKDFPQDTRQALKVQSASTCSIGLVLLVLYHRAGLYRQVTLVTNCPRGGLG